MWRAAGSCADVCCALAPCLCCLPHHTTSHLATHTITPHHSTPRHTTPHHAGNRYSPEQLYEVVAGVQHYAAFVPWCVGSTVLRAAPDGTHLEAELQIGFQMISER